MDFVKQLFNVFTEDSARDKTGFLRNKNKTDPKMTDLELFQSMPLGDLWEDASIASVYVYLRRNKHLVIPNSWEQVIDDFDAELDAKVA